MTKMLKQALKSVLSETEINEVFSSFDIIGDIVIIKIPDSMSTKKQLIADAILSKVKPVRSVFMQSSPVQGDFRVRGVEYIAGENRTLTIYKEHNCRFKVDVSKVYFSPRLSTERERIAALVNDGEVIVNMFAGICTFSIIIPKKHKCKIYSIDINPDAYSLCAENVKLNKVTESIVPMLGDAKEIIVNELKGKADRVLMPLPERAKEYLEYAVMALKEKGIIHYFTHVHSDSRKYALNVCEDELASVMKVKYEMKGARIVREVGPRFYQVAADVMVFK
ncbi:MAG TPA: class I SAM-dependent methyltransferase family protein [Nitrososphaerales archaeon]|nr:class I SAM-dependent methyltransferase family protein [Nitrososphaerales archaeon]